MLSNAPQPRVWIPRFHQPRKHDPDALTHALRVGVQRIVKQKRLDYGISHHAAETFPDLVSCSTSRMVVYSEFSDHAIYDPDMNRAQRAWHDGIHLRLNAGFDLASELRVARQQAHEISLITGDLLADFVYADLFASAYHVALWGHFPADQRSLVFTVMTTGQVGRF